MRTKSRNPDEKNYTNNKHQQKENALTTRCRLYFKVCICVALQSAPQCTNKKQGTTNNNKGQKNNSVQPPPCEFCGAKGRNPSMPKALFPLSLSLHCPPFTFSIFAPSLPSSSVCSLVLTLSFSFSLSVYSCLVMMVPPRGFCLWSGRATNSKHKQTKKTPLTTVLPSFPSTCCSFGSLTQPFWTCAQPYSAHTLTYRSGTSHTHIHSYSYSYIRVHVQTHTTLFTHLWSL